MQFNNQNRTAAKDAFNGLGDNEKATMLQSTVRLQNGNFTGSGVLVKDGNSISILTAKHNLTVKGNMDTPNVWNETQTNNLIYDFLEGLVVGYNPTEIIGIPKSTETFHAGNTDVEFRSGWGSWDYDLIMISIKENSALKNWALGNANRRIDYHSQRNFYNGNMVNRAVWVLGYGDVLNQNGAQPNMDHPIQVRSATTNALEATVQRDPHPQVFQNVLITPAANNSSTAPGDSGGPMFTINQGRVQLLGCSLGANYYSDHLDGDDDPIANNGSTYVLSNGALF